ncbi:MAG: degQ [Bacteroidetes bacterium]|nr:MAG: degQ [Bacteroidota bacterium]
MKRFITVFFIAAIGGAASLGLNSLFSPEQPVSKNQDIHNPVPVKMAGFVNAAPGTLADFREAAEATVHSVVHVKTKYTRQASANPSTGDPFHDWFFGYSPQQPREQEASGSGVIISGDGYIVTNNHVVKDADQVQVVLNDKRSYEAKVVGTDPSTDIALLKVEEKGLPFLSYGNSDEVKVGEWVLAVGNPFNLTSTVTAGIVSAKGRNINVIENDPDKGQNPIESFIQTDAAVNPGNSGGALVNTTGQLVGINTAIASQTGSYSGYSFAIPVNIVRKVVADLLEYGNVQRGYLGVSIRDIDANLAKEKNISTMKGVYVSGAMEGSAADVAGVREGDIITRVGTVEVNRTPELQEQIGRFRPGDKVMLGIRRGGKDTEVAVILKNANGGTKPETKEAENIAVDRLLGASFSPAKPDEMKRLGIENGLKINRLDPGKLRSAGLREGFIITTVDKKKIQSLEDLRSAIDNKKGGVLIEGVYPNGMRAYYAFGL